MKPGLLLVSAIPPFPATSGGATRIYYTLKYLSEKYTVYFLSYGDPITDPDERAFLDKHTAFWQIFPLRRRSLWSSLPYYFSCWKSGALERMIGKILDKHEICKIRIEFTQIAYLRQYLPREIPVTFVAHDISAVAFQRRRDQVGKVNNVASLARTGMNYANNIEVAAFERAWLPTFDEVVAVSRHDLRLLETMYHPRSLRLEPHGIDAVQLRRHELHQPVMLGYIGSSLHPPNQAAIDFTLSQVLPRLDRHEIEYQYLLAGSGHEEREKGKVHCCGCVDRVEEFYDQIDCLVAPIFAGSGTRIKILEALSFGVPVITTPVGAEGLEIDSPFLQIITREERALLAEAIVSAVARLELLYSQIKQTKIRNQLARQLEGYLWSRTFAGS